MKKVLTIAIIMMFVLAVMPALAEEAAAAKGKPISKVPGESSFQAASEHIALWGKSAPEARKCSLRGNTAETAKRRGTGAGTWTQAVSM